MGLDHCGLEPKKDVRRDAKPGFLYQRVSEALRSRVTSGVFVGGSKLPALNDIAAEFDVSAMTVRRAISALEREGHVQRLPGVGVFARSRHSTTTGALAFVGTALQSPFQMGIASGAQRACQRNGRAIYLLDGHLDAELEMSNLKRLPSSGAAGAVILPPFRHAKTVQALRDLHEAGFPMVVVDMTVPGIHTDLVTSDHEAGAHQAATHLLERGHSEVLFLTYPPYASSVFNRIQGYERALQDLGKPPLPEWKIWIDLKEHIAGFEQGRKWWGGYKAILPVLKERKPPLAVLAIEAYAGWGVYEACQELGLRIPDDVSVVGFDEVEIVHAMRPPMTVVAQRTDEIGRSAVELLGRRIEAGRLDEGRRKTFTQVVVEVDLIERGSVADLTSASGKH
jgi:DNA-binding LacI/PurR family transcriptional regulator